MNSPLRHPESSLGSRAHVNATPTTEAISIGLTCVIFAVRDSEPLVAVVLDRDTEQSWRHTLPCGLFSAHEHESLDAGLRTSVREQTGVLLNVARQLSTASMPLKTGNGSFGSAVSLAVSINYLALVGPQQCSDSSAAVWQSWYTHFPWEDWRHGRPACLTQEIEPRLRTWAAADAACDREPFGRTQRVRLCFGCDGARWDEEKVLERYELLREAGLIGAEASGGVRVGGVADLYHPTFGDHGRVMASAIAELRRTIKYRPDVFELMPAVFTLFELQKTVEAILGPHLHKQNFRRLVETGGLVEPTDQYRFRTGGRPAKLYRFRQDVLLERLAPGVRIKHGRA